MTRSFASRTPRLSFSFALVAGVFAACTAAACTVAAPDAPSSPRLADGGVAPAPGGDAAAPAPETDDDPTPRARCAQLVACVAKHAPATLAPITQAYGAKGTCWDELGDDACVAACGEALGQLRVEDDAACTFCTSQDDCSRSLAAGVCDLATNRCVACTEAEARDACEGRTCDPAKDQATCGVSMLCSRLSRACIEDRQGLACSSYDACGPDFACASDPRRGTGPRTCLRTGCQGADGRPIPGFCTNGSTCISDTCLSP